ncbi:hypothetical protein [Tsukamurella tyrosinosolvens]|uniref:hypothetical protein n=1 Tax=Tsukamurella tyrosinosolvens TaxID=57704 RepID=UPI000DF69FAE|nr:hypothetical protein [Tsukamurella tyrosinosolvens]RDB49350.1 hypothetical protein DVB87_03205 [Tsukamurella tyrosinosolvens]
MSELTYADELAAAAKGAGYLLGEQTRSIHGKTRARIVFCRLYGAYCASDPDQLEFGPKHRHILVAEWPVKVALWWLRSPIAAKWKTSPLPRGYQVDDTNHGLGPTNHGTAVPDFDTLVDDAEAGGPW